MSQIASQPPIEDTSRSAHWRDQSSRDQVAPDTDQIYPRSQGERLESVWARMDVHQVPPQELHVEYALIAFEKGDDAILKLCVGCDRHHCTRLPACGGPQSEPPLVHRCDQAAPPHNSPHSSDRLFYEGLHEQRAARKCRSLELLSGLKTKRPSFSHDGLDDDGISEISSALRELRELIERSCRWSRKARLLAPNHEFLLAE